jgi:Domain of unknown function (DUF6484)
MSQPSRKRRQPVLKVVRNTGVRVRGHLAGWLTAVESGQVLVDYLENPHGPLPARSTLDLATLKDTQSIAPDGRIQVLLVFEHERSDQPIVVGLLDPAPQKRPVEALVDGKRVVLDGQDEVVLRCGEASITLRRNGRVVIRGTYVETRAQGVNRIRGGSVQIN